MVQIDDTIVAIATPAGRGGIGVIRLSGPEAKHIALSMLNIADLQPGRAHYCEVRERNSSERLDEAVATYFAKPRSYTADDIVEIAAHGSPVLLQAIVQMALDAGARLAEPGEFTMRAFLNGRIDLIQAEAVRDLIESQTVFQAKVAAQQLEGALSKRVAPIKHQLVRLIALLEAGIDFAEDDVAVVPVEQITAAIDAAREQLTALLSTFTAGRLVHEGITLAVIGRPNVGKSSLFNRLVQRERAIVTDIPGTTRDAISEAMSLAGVPVRIVDTAGIRDTDDPVERIGVQRTLEAAAEADVVLHVIDCSQPSDHHEQELASKIAGRAAILVANKSDIGVRTIPDSIATSAVTGVGLDQLRSAIIARVTGSSDFSIQSGALTNARHEQLVRESAAALEKARAAAEVSTPDEMVLIDLYEALRALDALTGETTTDDVLGLIFSTFCIGK